jgi:hypothetical protein
MTAGSLAFAILHHGAVRLSKPPPKVVLRSHGNPLIREVPDGLIFVAVARNTAGRRSEPARGRGCDCPVKFGPHNGVGTPRVYADNADHFYCSLLIARYRNQVARYRNQAFAFGSRVRGRLRHLFSLFAPWRARAKIGTRETLDSYRRADSAIFFGTVFHEIDFSL